MDWTLCSEPFAFSVQCNPHVVVTLPNSIIGHPIFVMFGVMRLSKDEASIFAP